MQDLKAIRFIPGSKVSHDYEGNKVTTYSYRELIEKNVEAIGIPCKQNGLIVIDIDVAGLTHKNDGREFWQNFCHEYSIPDTYVVKTQSGGFHFYFWLPKSVNPETFRAPGQLAPGVDVKWNGWVGAPPTPGYSIAMGDVSRIAEAPVSLLAFMATRGGEKVFDVTAKTLDLHKPFSPAQITDLKNKLQWMQLNATLSRSEWRDGLFALKAGIEDPVLLDELACAWTMNRAYVPGDEEQARSIVAKADRHGPIGPGSIFAIIKTAQIQSGAPITESHNTIQEILDISRVPFKINKDGSLKVEPSETNAAALLGAIIAAPDLYYDVRQDLYIYKGKVYSDAELVNIFMPMIQSTAFGLGFDNFRKSHISAGLDILMASRKKDPHIEYLKGLRWDGVSRIEKFFVDYVGADDSEYIRKVGMNFWTSMAARGLSPGCKLDSMVVLEGHEGIAKSSLVSAIGGLYTFASNRKDSLDNLDALRSMHQAIIVELPELMGLINQEAEKVKAFLAQPFDNIRALYAKKSIRAERGFVFFGTTNSDRYLATAMGIRRFWPVRIPRGNKGVNLSKVKADRDQLFAEAIELYKNGYSYWEMPSDLLDPVVTTRRNIEPLVGPIKEMLPTLGHQWSMMDVYRRLESSGYIPRGLTKQMSARIEEALRRLGCECIEDMWTDKEQVKASLLVTLQSIANLDALI